MRKWLLLLLALCLCCSVAAAEVSVESKTVEVRSLEMNTNSSRFIMQNKDRMYQVVDADLTPLSGEYSQISNSGSQFIIKEDSGEGLLDSDGQLLIAPIYDDIKVISDRWAAGIKLKVSTAENYDYKSWFSDVQKFYLIDSVDIYYRGEKRATLSRMEYDSANAFGDYITITSRDKKNSAYNKDFVKSPYTPKSSYSEYDEDWNTGKYIHVGSGQEAFAASCTLTPEEVTQTVAVNNREKLVDLQGNVLADMSDYPHMKSLDKESGMVRVKDNSKLLGLVDSDGRLVVPCQYEDFDYNFVTAKQMGYIYAVKNGKGGFVNLKDGTETGFAFLESAGKNRSAFIVVEDPREGTILISAEAGELPGRYKEVDVPYSSASMFATVTEFDGRIHVIDGFGNDILQDQPEIRNSYDVTYSKDGTLILVRDTSRNYHIYKITRVEEAPVDPDNNDNVTTENGNEGNEGTGGETTEVPGAWTCENGHEGNTGKFCSECGAAKPVAEANGPWTCENGHEGNTGKFCTECGAPKPE